MSSARPRAYAQVDVFASTPYLGNPVGVVLDAVGVTDEDMQRVARWTNLSETTFVFPPTTAEADYKLRIFTPGGELPFAGHPTLGSAYAWREHGGIPRSSERIVQECVAGLVEVRSDGDALSFAAPPTVRSGPLEETFVGDIVAAFGIDRERILAHQWVDNGPGWAAVELATAEEVLALEPDLSIIPHAMVGAIGAYPAGSDRAYELRTFAPAVGVSEDPVCGSMNASIAQWFSRERDIPPTYQVSQGARVGRAGTISITAGESNGIWVGGHCTSLIVGSITL
ncbi:PhzF family phenazine biosynthesis protein [Rhodococcus erythropolis]|uniref:PhzF family phenazine biosynthesis protein n=1 Tax=Rhodococcus erythropolis TaxID=1833 RepID=UPI001E5EBCAF|nr:MULTISPECIES: PhzF family phenazine biosynthesis protein [Rhodococcus erythropolis group]MCD2109270.1 PhzF family phenazine biosynthesis protein [Rhodococcus qingshengii]MCZ4528194.1 PhzF family phenazine biosynthesis protein [Rhodococcus erythropolis]